MNVRARTTSRPARRALLVAPVVVVAGLLAAAPGAQAAQGARATQAGQAAPAQTPALTLEPAEAPAGATVTVRGSGFDTCAEPDSGDTFVEVLFDDAPRVADEEPAGRGSFTAVFTVPAGAAAGGHVVRARCWYDSRPPGPYLAEQPFRVVPSPTVAPGAPALRVRPATGYAGDTVTATGTGFAGCASAVDVLWDGRRLRSAPVAGGGFETRFAVPDGAGPHVVGARCAGAAGGSAPLATAAFTTLARVTAPPVPTPPASRAPATAPATTAPPATRDTDPATLAPTGSGPDTASGAPDRAVAGDRAERLTWLPAALPQRLDTRAGDLARSLALAALLVLLVGFPAELFNKTVEENADRIRRAIRWLPRGPRLRVPTPVRLGAFTVVAAVLTSFADPGQGWNRDALLTVVALLVAIPVTLLAFELPLELWCRRGGHARAALRVLPFALVVAAVLALVSRVAGFQPAYVYGLVAGYAVLATRTLTRDQAGQAVLVGAASLLAVSLLAWAAWLTFDAGPLAENVLAAVAVVGVEGLVFALVPLRFLDGAALWSWGRLRWAVAYLVAAFVFVHVLLASRAATIDAAALGRMLALFLAFGVGSLAFWAWFRFTPERA